MPETRMPRGNVDPAGIIVSQDRVSVSPLQKESHHKLSGSDGKMFSATKQQTNNTGWSHQNLLIFTRT